MSVTNPGLSISVPPTRISAPSASSRPASGPTRARCAAPARPARPRARSARRRRCCRRSAAGSSTTAPIDLADLDDHVDLDDRHDHERRHQQPTSAGRGAAAGAVRDRASARHDRRSAPAQLLAALAQAPRGDPLAATRPRRDRSSWSRRAPARRTRSAPRGRAARRAGSARPCRSGRRSRCSARSRGRSSPGRVRRNSRKPAVASRTGTPSSVPDVEVAAARERLAAPAAS